MPEGHDQQILIYELIHLTGKKAKDEKPEKQILRRVVAYHEEKNTTIEIITNKLDWKASTVAALYRRR